MIVSRSAEASLRRVTPVMDVARGFRRASGAFAERRALSPSVGRFSRASSALSLTSLELLEFSLQRFELLARFSELAFRGEPLVVGEIARCVGDEGVQV